MEVAGLPPSENSIRLGPNDRFLTLAATDGDDGPEWDHIRLGDPRLVLAINPDPTRQVKPGMKQFDLPLNSK
jgi:hypothetical protein